MSLFAESSWEADAVGDKLSRQFFQTKKKIRKIKKKNETVKDLKVSQSKKNKSRQNIQSGDSTKASLKQSKAKFNKKRLSFDSVGSKANGQSVSKISKPRNNIQSADSGTATDNRAKLNSKKRKRSFSNSAEANQSSPKKSKSKISPDEKSIKSELTKLLKKNKNAKNGFNGELDDENEKSFLSKKKKAVINKKSNRNSKTAEKKSVRTISESKDELSNQETKSQRKRKKKKLKKIGETVQADNDKVEGDASTKNVNKFATGKLNVQILEKLLIMKETKANAKKKIFKEPESLRDRMMSQLRASRFRYLNETLYSSPSSESKDYFKEDPDAFAAYHSGYRQQVEQWPLNPLDVIISSIEKMSKDWIIADFGCGEARLADSVSQKVHSFDFVAVNEKVKACDMAHTPLLTNGVNVVVFCLSLMGTNLADYLIEANRVLKTDGILKIADVESRFENVDEFVTLLKNYGFVNTWKDLSHNLFYFMDFKKISNVGGKTKNLPEITLKPCLYKKR